MPIGLLLALVAGVGLFAYEKSKAAPAPPPPAPPHPSGGTGPTPTPTPPSPVTGTPMLHAGEAYHVTAIVTLDPSADIVAVLQGHTPAGLALLSPPTIVPGAPAGTITFDAGWMGQDGALLSSLTNAAITFTGAIDAGPLLSGAGGTGPIPTDPGIVPGLDPGLLGGGGGGLPPIPVDPGVLQGSPSPTPPQQAFGGLPGGGIGMPPPPHSTPISWFGPGLHPGSMPRVPVVSFGAPGLGQPALGAPQHPIASFGPHSVQHAMGVQAMRTAGTLSQYHPNAGSAHRHWPYHQAPAPSVGGTLSGYNPVQHDWNRYPLRRAGSGNGHQ